MGSRCIAGMLTSGIAENGEERKKKYVYDKKSCYGEKSGGSL